MAYITDPATGQTIQLPSIDPAYLPRLNAPEQPNALSSGLNVGGHEAVSLAASAIGATAAVAGSDQLRERAAAVAADRSQRAAAIARADLEGVPGTEGGPALGSVGSWLMYQTGRQIPTMAAMLAGTALVPQAAVPGALARAGASVPRVLGGGGLRAGMSASAEEAARRAGATWAKDVVGATAGSYPFSVGELYQAAQEGGDDSRAGAVKAMALGLPHAAIEALEPAQLKKFAEAGASGKGLLDTAKQIGKAALATGVAQVPQEAAQTMLEMSLRPDLSISEKTSAVVEAAVTAAAVGGLLGGTFKGVGALRNLSKTPPEATTDEALKQGIDAALNPEPTTPAVPSEPVVVDPAVMQAPPGGDPTTPAEPVVVDPVVQEPPGSDLTTPAEPIVTDDPAVPAWSATQTLVDVLGQRAGTARVNPVVARLAEATDEVAQARMVRDMMVERGDKAPATLRRMAEYYGLVDQQGSPRDITKELEDVDTRIALERRATTPDEATVGALEARRAELETRQSIWQGVDQRIADNRRAVQQYAERAIGAKGNSLIRKLDAEDLPSLVGAVIDRINDDRATMTVNRLADHFGYTGDPATSGFRNQIADLDAQIALARTEQSTALDGEEVPAVVDLQAKRDDLVERQTALEAALAARGTPIPPPAEATVVETPTVENTPETAPVPQAPREARTVPPRQPSLAERSNALPRTPQSLLARNLQELALARREARVDPATQPNVDALMRDRRRQQAAVRRGDHTVPYIPTTPRADVAPTVDAAPQVAPGAALPLAQDMPVRERRALAPNPALETPSEPQTALPAGVQVPPPGASAAPVEPLSAGDTQATPSPAGTSSTQPSPVDAARERIRERLNTSDQERLRKHFGHEQFDERTEQAFLGTVLQAIRQGLSAIPAKIRSIVKKFMAEVKAFIADDSGMLGGRRAAGANLTALHEAELRVAAGADRETVRRQTGWYEDIDGRWKFEISDREARLKADIRTLKETPAQTRDDVLDPQRRADRRYHKLSDVLDHKRLFAQYPDLKNLPIEVTDNELFAGSYNPDLNRIMLSTNARNPLSTLLHEVQHWVQEREDFARGGNSDMMDEFNDTNLAAVRELRTNRLNEVEAELQPVADLAGKPIGELGLFDVRDYVRTLGDGVDAAVVRRELNEARTEYRRLAEQVQEVDRVFEWAPTVRLLEAEYAAKRVPYDDVLTARRPVAHLLPRIRDDLYRLLHGEAEARAVQFRQNMTVEQRQAVSPVETVSAAAGGAPTIVDRERGVAASTIPDMAQRAPQVVEQSKQALRQLTSKLPDLQAGARRIVLGWNTENHIAENYKDLFPEVQAHAEARRDQTAIHARFLQPTQVAVDRFRQLEGRDAKMAERISNLTGATAARINPAMKWSEQVWLHDEPNNIDLRRMAEQYHEEYRKVARVPAAREVYETLIAVNEADQYMRMATALDTAMRNQNTGEPWAGFEADPAYGYVDRSDLHSNPKGSRDYWLNELQLRLDAVDAAIGTDAAQWGGNTELGKSVERLKSRLEHVRQVPYFHLGRYGDHYVSFGIKLDDNGLPDTSTVRRMSAELERAGFGDVELEPGSGESTVYMRVDGLGQMANLRAIVEGFEAKGWTDNTKSISWGPRSEQALQGQPTSWVRTQIAAINASGVFDPSEDMSDKDKASLSVLKEKYISSLRQLELDLLPDNALRRVLIQRDAKPGYSKDMLRNFQTRSEMSANAIAHKMTAAKTHNALEQMRRAVLDSRTDRTLTPQQQQTKFDIYNEIVRRELSRPDQYQQSPLDTLRAINYSYYLGLNPAYAATQFIQVPMVLWPELAKTRGFAGAAKDIAAVTSDAFKIVKAVFDDAYATGGLNRASEGVVTSTALQRAGVSAATAKVVMAAVNRGDIDIGGFARESIRASEGPRSDKALDKVLRFASSTATYMEMLTRVIAVLAANKAHGGKPDAERYISHVVKQAMFDFNTYNKPRQTSKSGMFGQLSPIVFAFMDYAVNMLEKFYREVGTAISGKSPEDRRQARRFLGAHLVATLMFAGTSGLPFAPVFARTLDHLADWIGDDEDEPHDMLASFRVFLSAVFGAEVGAMIAGGVIPRALGVDISQRVGSQNLLPFTQLYTDRRKFEDVAENWAMQAQGAPMSMIYNVAGGAAALANGDVYQGLQKMMPSSVRNLMKAGTMASDGYIDAQGRKIPLEAGPLNYMAQALGFTPAEKAEYDEERRTLSGRAMVLSREASTLRRQMATAIERGDMDKAADVLAEIKKFDAAHPERAVLPTMSGTLRGRAKTQQQGEAGVPLGISLKDYLARGPSPYAWAPGQ